MREAVFPQHKVCGMMKSAACPANEVETGLKGGWCDERYESPSVFG